LFALQRTGYAFIGIAYGILAGLALIISAWASASAQKCRSPNQNHRRLNLAHGIEE
jgi:hypothetical protein